MAAGPPPLRAASAPACPRWDACGATCRFELCEAIDAAVLPRPEQRGTLADLRAALQDATRAVADDPGAVLASRTEAVGRAGRAALPSRPSERLIAAAGAAALTASALAWLGPEPLIAPGIGAAVAAAACALLPRLGWIACAVTLVAWLAVPAGGIAIVVALALAPVPLLLRRARGSWWSAPAVAPVLDVIGGGAAWLAIAGQAARPWHRAALGALGWWAVLAGRVLDHGRGAWADHAHGAWHDGDQGRRRRRDAARRRRRMGAGGARPAPVRTRPRVRARRRRAPRSGAPDWPRARRRWPPTSAAPCLAPRSPGYLRSSCARRARPPLRSMTATRCGQACPLP